MGGCRRGAMGRACGVLVAV
jgi:hypothetical protein